MQYTNHIIKWKQSRNCDAADGRFRKLCLRNWSMTGKWSTENKFIRWNFSACTGFNGLHLMVMKYFDACNPNMSFGQWMELKTGLQEIVFFLVNFSVINVHQWLFTIVNVYVTCTLDLSHSGRGLTGASISPDSWFWIVLRKCIM